MAKVLYPLGDGASSTTEAQKRVFMHNRRHGGELGQHMMTCDVDGYYPNLEQEHIKKDVNEEVDKAEKHNFHFS